MKSALHRLLSVILVLTMCLMLTTGISASDEISNGTKVVVLLDESKVQYSDSDQTIQFKVATTEDIAFDGISYYLACSCDGALFKSVDSTIGREAYTCSFTQNTLDTKDGKPFVTYYQSDGENMVDNLLGLFTVTIPGGTEAGTYSISVEELDLTHDYGDEYANNLSASATLTIENAVVAPTYTVTWKTADGAEVIETDEGVDEGTKPEFDGAEPSKAADDQYNYIFAGWATEPNQETGTVAADLPAVNDDTVYYAAFSKTTRTYTVIFQNHDGEVLQSSEVPYGETPEYNGESTPEKAPDDTCDSYIFTGWTPEITAVNADTTYTAAFEAHTHDFYVAEPTWNWKAINGTWYATATFTCYCGETKAETADVVKTEGTETDTYTATFGEYSNVKSVTKNYVVTYDGKDTTYVYGQPCNLTAAEASDWYVGETLMASGTTTYSFAVTASVTVTSSPSEKAEQEPVITATITSPEAKKAVFNAKWSMSQSCSVKSVTVYRGNSSKANLVDADLLVSKGTKKVVDLLVSNGDYTLNLSNLTTGKYQNVIIVVTYTDASGETKELRSSVVNVKIS